MVSVAVYWVLAPAALGALCTGLGLLVAGILGRTYSFLGLLAGGFAVLVVLAWLLTRTATLAGIAAPALAVASAGGWLLWWRRSDTPRRLELDGAGLSAGLAAYAAYAAPVVASGKATWTGWIKLDDTATWLTLTARNFDAQREPLRELTSTYGRVLQSYSDYPSGAFTTLGAVPRILGLETVWFYQPFMAFAALLLAVGIYRLLVPFIAGRGWRAAAAFVCAQAATLYAYVLWGGVKEIVLAALLATIVLFAGQAARRVGEPRLLVFPLVAVAAFLAVSGTSGLAYMVPVVFAFALVWWAELRPSAQRAAAWTALIAVAVAVPVLITKKLPVVDSLRPDLTMDLGNLIFGLSPLQFSGIWPVGDFRIRPDALGLVEVVIAMAALLAALGVGEAIRRRTWAIPVALAATLAVAVRAGVEGQDWLGAKALSVGSPFFLLAAFAGAGSLSFGVEYLPRWLGGRAVAVAAAALMAFGVIWSNVLAYHEAWLAPREPLAELAWIGNEYAGSGPALFTEYQVFGARYFLRESDAEAASDLRSRQVRLRDGSVLAKGTAADIGAFDDSDVAGFPLLVLRRSASSSHPPAGYELSHRGEYFDVWQRASGTVPTVATLPLGTLYQPGGVADCAKVERLAADAGPGTQLAYVERKPATVVSLASGRLPEGWREAEPPGGVLPTTSGTVDRRFEVKEGGRKQLWVAGSYPGRLTLSVDGREVFTSSSLIQFTPTQLSPAGSVSLRPGSHLLKLEYSRDLLIPGSGADVAVADPLTRQRLKGPNGDGTFPLGPVVVGSDTPAASEVSRLPVSQARELCGRYLDWVSVVRTG